MTYHVLDLFSGIGGFSLGLERTGGFKTVAFCEIDPFCRKVLKKHWPDVPIYQDVRTLTADRLRADGIAPDVICGGFPCQDISVAGKGAGIKGERSGLWSEYARIIGEVRPRYVIVENVAALLGRGLNRVLGDLAALGFDAEWHCIPASAVGAPHRRDRLWLVSSSSILGAHEKALADTARERCGKAGQHSKRHSQRLASGSQVLAYARDERCEDVQGSSQAQGFNGYRTIIGDCFRGGTDNDWSLEPDVGRVAHGVPSRVDRLRALGNAVVPQIPELIGNAILQAEAA